MCPGTDSASKDIPGAKGGRCVRLTTYHLHVPIVKKSGGLNLLFRPVMGQLYLLPLSSIYRHVLSRNCQLKQVNEGKIEIKIKIKI
jgi:hypothetical protein